MKGTSIHPMPGSLPRRLDLLALLLLLVAAAWLHAPALSGDFVYDDRLLVLSNPVVADAARWPEAFTSGMWDFADAETARAVGCWRPVAVLLLMLSWAVGGADPWVFHCVSLVVHLAALAACWRCARTLSRSGNAALVAAALWAFHPTHVESVAWISAIGDPAFGLCAFLALDAWMRAREAGRAPWVAGGWFALALLSKEMALALVPIVLLLELALGRERFVPLAAYNEGYAMGEGESERRLALSPAFLRSLGVGAELFEPGLACWYENNCCCAASRQTSSCDRRTRASTR